MSHESLQMQTQEKYSVDRFVNAKHCTNLGLHNDRIEDGMYTDSYNEDYEQERESENEQI